MVFDYPNGSPVIQSAKKAWETIDPVFRDSPQFVSESLSRDLSCHVTLKIETINPVGCFKARGADYLISERLRELSPGVVAASAGNFGQGLAFAARKRGIGCWVYAPVLANTLKVERIRALGANVVLEGQDFDQAKDRARVFAEESGRFFIEDGREPELSIGAGTIALELLRGGAEYDVFLVPLGNGSLLNGMAIVAKCVSPNIRVIGVCSEGAPAMARSFSTRPCVTTGAVNTIADGIAVRVPVAESLPGLLEYVEDVLLVSDDDLKSAFRVIFNHHRLIVEPAGVAGVAALLRFQERFSGLRIAIPLCGGNLTDKQIKEWLNQG